MNYPFANSVALKVSMTPNNLTDLDQYLIEKLVSAWKDDHYSSSSASYRGNLKLEQHLKDNILTITDMSERLKKIKSYGMAELMKIQL